MRPALNKFVRDWLGDNPPREALDALHAAIRADREAALGHLRRTVEPKMCDVWSEDWSAMVVTGEDFDGSISECWKLPTGLEE